MNILGETRKGGVVAKGGGWLTLPTDSRYIKDHRKVDHAADVPICMLSLLNKIRQTKMQVAEMTSKLQSSFLVLCEYAYC